MIGLSRRKSLIMSQGDFSILFAGPLAAAALIIALFLLVSPFIPYLRIPSFPSFLS